MSRSRIHSKTTEVFFEHMFVGHGHLKKHETYEKYYSSYVGIFRHIYLVECVMKVPSEIDIINGA